MTIVSIGEILWDVFEDSESLGGAPFNFAVHALRLGHEVIFVSAVGNDRRGRAALARAEQLGLSTEFIQTVPGIPTGTVSVRLSAGQPDFTIHRPAAFDAVRLGDAEMARIAARRPGWVYFGTLHQEARGARAATAKLLASLPLARRFYDVNLRKDCYTPELVSVLMATADAVKVNEFEAAEIDRMYAQRHAGLEDFTARWSRRLGWRAVAVTRGAEGCFIRAGNETAAAPAVAVQVADTVGAGDAFAAAFLHGIAEAWPAQEIAEFANCVGALVASRPGGVPAWSAEECQRRTSTRRRGGAET